jgi:hypothetical protein
MMKKVARPPDATRQRGRAVPVSAPPIWFRRAGRPLVLPGITLPARPGLLVLSTVLLVALLSVLTSYETTRQAGSAGFVLPDELSSSNLNNTSAEAPTSATAPVVQPLVPEGPALQLVEVPKPPQEFPKQLGSGPAASILPVAASEPALEDCCYLQGPHLGDTPMMRTWKLIGLHTLLAGMMTAGPALAETSGPPSDSEKLTEVQKQLDEMKRSLTDLQKAVGPLSTLDRRINDLIEQSTKGAQDAQNQIGEVRKELAALRSEFEALRNRTSDSARVSRFPPTDVGAPPSTAVGRVELINTYPSEVTVVVNRRTYHLAPGEHRLSDPVPAGTFTYEVLGITPQRNRPLAGEQVFTVWVHPQP